jgi:putative DNA primase/helicase
MLNAHALKNLEGWFPTLFDNATPLNGGYEAVDAESVVITATADGITDGVLPTDLVADVSGMPREEAARQLADWLGFELTIEKSKAGDAKARIEAEEGYIAKVGFDVRTQNGCAQLFAKWFSNKWRFDHASGKWHEWDGTRWRKDGGQRGFQAMRELCADQARHLGKTLSSLLQMKGFIQGAEKLARGEPALSVENPDHWDSDHWLLGTPGGTVDLRTGKLRPADPAYMITKLTSVAPAETADCPQFMKFMEEVTLGDPELIRFLQQYLGYCLTGDASEQQLVFLFGKGQNGKGILQSVAEKIMGEYAQTAAMETFAAQQGERHSTNIAMLKGARLVTGSETEEGRAWAEALIKQMTGQDKLTARFMRQDNFTFQPTFKLFFIGNHKPVLRNVDDAMKRRLNFVPFRFKPQMRDERLEEKLLSEAPGILRWMLQGCLDWQANGLVRPQVVLDATAEYFQSQDLLTQFIEDECEIGADHREQTALLFGAWTLYAMNAGEKSGSRRSFTEALMRLGFEPGRTKTFRYFNGLSLKSKVTQRGGLVTQW